MSWAGGDTANLLVRSINAGHEPDASVCVRAQGYFWEMIFWLVLPLVLEAVIIIGTALWWLLTQGRFRMSQLLAAAAPLSLRMLFLVYPIVTRKAFQAFSWYEFKAEGSWLRVDVSLAQGSLEARQAQAVAVVAIFLCAALPI